ncbi:hypothetical protein SD81_021295 [Tolypothrix campylonemoides VB511288]|nr:hypothetical protein SD81_021295 [Tolypothrix campylonemoides VB511288]
MDNGHLPQRGEPPSGYAFGTLRERQLPRSGSPPAALVSPQGSVLQMDTDKSVVDPNEKRYSTR